MKIVNIHEAKSTLSRLLVEVGHGETVVIARAGRPVARIIPFEPLPPPQRSGFGVLAGAITVPDDFDDFLANEIARDFEGDPCG